jgi:hypothetical protein
MLDAETEKKRRASGRGAGVLAAPDASRKVHPTIRGGE